MMPNENREFHPGNKLSENDLVSYLTKIFWKIFLLSSYI